LQFGEMSRGGRSCREKGGESAADGKKAAQIKTRNDAKCWGGHIRKGETNDQRKSRLNTRKREKIGVREKGAGGTVSTFKDESKGSKSKDPKKPDGVKSQKKRA